MFAGVETTKPTLPVEREGGFSWWGLVNKCVPGYSVTGDIYFASMVKWSNAITSSLGVLISIPQMSFCVLE